MNLYEISSDLQEVITRGMVVDDETGEILFDGEDLEALETAFNDKLEGCGLYIKNELAEIEAMRAEENRLSERRHFKEAKVNRLKDYMLQSMERTGTTKLDTARVAIGTRKSKRVIIDDQSQLPRSFVNIKETVDKSALQRALKLGDVSGAHLEENISLQLK